MKDSKSAHSTPLKNSSLRCPNTCSVAPLSRQLPFRHALPGAVPPELAGPPRVLVLPAHVAVDDRRGPGRHPREQAPEHLLLLGHVRARRHRPGDDLLRAEVVDRGEVRLAPGLPEFRDVGPELLPRGARAKVTRYQVVEPLADRAAVGVVAMVAGLPADAAADAELPHHLEDRLVRYPRAQLGPQAHRYLAVAAPVRRPREDLAHGPPELWPGRSRRVRCGIVVARRCEPRGREQVA